MDKRSTAKWIPGRDNDVSERKAAEKSEEAIGGSYVGAEEKNSFKGKLEKITIGCTDQFVCPIRFSSDRKKEKMV